MTGRRALLGGLLVGGGAVAFTSFAPLSAQAAKCLASPTETRGPFPADGSNGRGQRINVLDLDGIVRRDLRPSFGGLGGRAEGVPLELELHLSDAASCAPRPGRAVYLWQNDAAGDYSLYSRTDVNYLRGIQTADVQGRVRFTLIVPGCYGGRYPHCHFEVFDSVVAAQGSGAPLLVSQLAFPDAECRAIYRSDSRYGDSLRNLEQQPITRDFVFADASAQMRAQQTVALAGSPEQGYRGTATIVV